MMRVLVLFLMCFCIYLPSTSAELYKNQDYNFQMNIPDGWNSFGENDEYVLKRKITKNMAGKIVMGNFGLKVSHDKYYPTNATLDNITKEQEKDLAAALTQALQEKYPNGKITYSDYIHVNGKKFLMLKLMFDNNLYKLTYLLGVFNRTDYELVFVTYDDSGQYEQQFFDMLKTLRPIVGDSDGDFEEEIMYYNNIAK